ncbi:hypothetical protein A2U01_0100339, partial [Trifolium medium]|nr:hypothetical protein [Trifolium medium]
MGGQSTDLRRHADMSRAVKWADPVQPGPAR